MGKVAQILLVIRRFFLCSLFLTLAACGQDNPSTPVHERPLVDAGDYDSFWLWAGVKPQPVLFTAKSVYVLKGEVTGIPARLVSLRGEAPTAQGPEIWMVIRVDTLDWTPELYQQVNATLLAWKVRGIQIDFDAATRNIDGYAAFLKKLRTSLPSGTKLSITGLLDWSANGDPEGLKKLSGIVDEVVIQTYQGRHTIPGYSQYLKRLDNFPIPFQIGLVQNGEWQEPQGLKDNPNFQGYVVFLLNQE